MIATYKNKSFQVSTNKKYIMNGIAWGGSLSTESQEKLGSKPSTYIKGASLDVLSFQITLKATLNLKVRKEIEDWEKIKLNAQPDYLIIGNKPLGVNKWLLKSTNASAVELDGDGNMIEAVLKLDFEEYVREGKAQQTKNNSATTSFVNTQADQSIFDPPEKTSQKRNNNNAFTAYQDLLNS